MPGLGFKGFPARPSDEGLAIEGMSIYRPICALLVRGGTSAGPGKSYLDVQLVLLGSF